MSINLSSHTGLTWQRKKKVNLVSGDAGCQDPACGQTNTKRVPMYRDTLEIKITSLQKPTWDVNNESQQTPCHQKLQWESLQDSAVNERANTPWLLPNQGYHSKSREQIMGLICILSSRSNLFSVAFLFSTHYHICFLAGVAKPPT